MSIHWEADITVVTLKTFYLDILAQPSHNRDYYPVGERQGESLYTAASLESSYTQVLAFKKREVFHHKASGKSHQGNILGLQIVHVFTDNPFPAQSTQHHYSLSSSPPQNVTSTQSDPPPPKTSHIVSFTHTFGIFFVLNTRGLHAQHCSLEVGPVIAPQNAEHRARTLGRLSTNRKALKAEPILVPTATGPVMLGERAVCAASTLGRTAWRKAS